MKLISGDLGVEILARGHHYHHHYSNNSGSGDGVIDWWEWLIIAVGVVAIVWGLVKKFSSD
ncbi:hypothetical protein [Streptomyces sp. NPDC048650]|uniref:hypothetical protein n=1 Tax=unclassified Streptomyces TaxID=2593676 RepID=UPI00371427DC